LYQVPTLQKSDGQELTPHVVVMGASTSVQVLVPLHVRVVQASLAHSISVPEHAPPPQVSPQVQLSPSSQAAESLHCHVPPAFVQMPA
jgi:hypothetical protein